MNKIFKTDGHFMGRDERMGTERVSEDTEYPEEETLPKRQAKRMVRRQCRRKPGDGGSLVKGLS